MPYAETIKFYEYLLEVEFDPVGDAGTYTTICGLESVNIGRSAEVETETIPHCPPQQGKPPTTSDTVRSLSQNVSASGKYAKSSHNLLLTWWRSGATLNARLRNLAAAVGEIEIEEGPMLLRQFDHRMEDGRMVTADMEMSFDGLPEVTLKAA